MAIEHLAGTSHRQRSEPHPNMLARGNASQGVGSASQLEGFAQRGWPIGGDQIEAFRTIASARSFGRAAQKLQISQSAISHRVKSLESALGLQLFERSRGRGAQLTSAGLALLQYADEERALRVRFAAQVGGSGGSQRMRQLTIAVGQISSRYVLPRVLPRFHARHPNILLQVASCTADEMISLVASEKADVGVIDEALVDDRFSKYTVAVDNALLIAPPGVAAKYHEPSQLSRLPFAVHPRGTYLRRLADEWARSLGNELDVLIESDYTDLINSSVISGLALAVTSEVTVAKELRERAVVAVAAQPFPQQRQICIIASKARGITSEGEAFGRVLQEAHPWPLRAPMPEFPRHPVL